MPWISRPCCASSASSSALRSSELRYSEPSKLNLMALTRLALHAKVEQPITTPIITPAMKPQQTMISAIASSDRYSIGCSCRAEWASQR